MDLHRPRVRRLASAMSAALIALTMPLFAPAAQAADPTPAADVTPTETYTSVPATAELQLLNGAGIKASESVASSGSEQWVGKRAQGRPVVSRLFYSFDLSTLPADQITSVRLEHWQVSSPNRACNLDSYGPTVDVATTEAPSASPQWPGPAVTSSTVSSGYAVGSERDCASRNPQQWNVTEIVRAAAESSPTVTLRMASANETLTSGYRRYDIDAAETPYLRITLLSRPNQPTALEAGPLTPSSPASPLLVATANPWVSANITTPGGCRGISAVHLCLRARYEVTAPDGTVVDSADLKTESVVGDDTVAHIRFFTGPLEEGTTYLVRIWGINTESGLESSQPGALSLRADFAPTFPVLATAPNWIQPKSPMELTVTSHDSDAAQACWRARVTRNAGATTITGCTDIAADTPTTVRILGPDETDEEIFVTGSIWIVDEQGTEGPWTSFSRYVL